MGTWFVSKVDAARIILIIMMIVVLMLCTGGMCVAEDCTHPSSTWLTGATYGDIVMQELTCDTCGEVLEKKAGQVSLVSDGKFVYTPNEFVERINSVYDVLSKDYNSGSYTVISSPMEGDITCFIANADNDLVAIVQFSDGEEIMVEGMEDTAEISGLMAMVMSEDMEEWVDVFLGVLLMSDNSLEVSDAANLIGQIAASSTEGKTYTYNDITYAMLNTDESVMLVVTLDVE